MVASAAKLAPGEKAPQQVYALIDPRDAAVMYVGKSVDPKGRLAQHVSGKPASIAVKRWTAELKGLGLKPTVAVLYVVPHGDGDTAEKFFIGLFAAINPRLLNVHYKCTMHGRNAAATFVTKPPPSTPPRRPRWLTASRPMASYRQIKCRDAWMSSEEAATWLAAAHACFFKKKKSRVDWKADTLRSNGPVVAHRAIVSSHRLSYPEGREYSRQDRQYLAFLTRLLRIVDDERPDDLDKLYTDVGGG